MNPWLSIVIPTIGRPEGMRRLLESIFRQPLGLSAAAEVLVVADTYAVPHPEAQFETTRELVFAGHDGWRWLEYDAGLHCWGQPQRSYGARQATGDWVAFSQDDNILAADALDAIWMAVSSEPHKRPLFFRIRTYWGDTVWRERQLAQGNIDADCLVLPRAIAQEVTWGLRYEGDFDAAVAAMQRAQGDVGWCEEQIAIARPEQADVWW